MKSKTTLIIAFIASLHFYAQQYSIGYGSDLKILLFGTDNQFTSHSPRFNFTTKFDFIDERNNYLGFGYTNTDLDIDYQAWYFSGGKQFLIQGNISIIPQFEIGKIIRNGPGEAYDVKPLFVATNIALRYQMPANLIAEFAFNVQLARDLPNRSFRYGGIFSVYYPIFEN